MKEAISNHGTEKTQSGRADLKLILGGQASDETSDVANANANEKARETNFTATRLRTLAQQKFPHVVAAYEKNLVGKLELDSVSAEDLITKQVWLPLARELEMMLENGITREQTFALVLAKIENGNAFLALIKIVQNLRDQETRPALRRVV